MTPVDIALANERVQAANAQLEAQAQAAPTIETYGGAPFSIAPRVAERELPPARNLAQTVASGGMSYAPQLPDTGRSGIYYHPTGAQEAYQWGGIPMSIYQDDPYATATGRVVQTPWGLGWQALQGAVSRYPHVLNGVPNDAWSIVSQWMPQIPMWPQATWQPPQAMPRPAVTPAPASRRRTTAATPPTYEPPVMTHPQKPLAPMYDPEDYDPELARQTYLRTWPRGRITPEETEAIFQRGMAALQPPVPQLNHDWRTTEPTVSNPFVRPSPAVETPASPLPLITPPVPIVDAAREYGGYMP